MLFEKQPTLVYVDEQRHYDDLYISISVRAGHESPRYLMLIGNYDLMWERQYAVMSKSPLLTEDDILLIIQAISEKPYRQSVSSLLIGFINEKNSLNKV